MLALTLYPWWVIPIAYLPEGIAKRTENRSWCPKRQLLRGERIAIHAGAIPWSCHGFRLQNELIWTVRPAWPRATVNYSVRQFTCPPEIVDGWHVQLDGRPLPFPERAIVCTARVADWDRVENPSWESWDEPGLWHWRLAEVITLPRPVHVERGYQRLWRLPDDVEARVLAGQAEVLRA